MHASYLRLLPLRVLVSRNERIETVQDDRGQRTIRFQSKRTDITVYVVIESVVGIHDRAEGEGRNIQVIIALYSSAKIRIKSQCGWNLEWFKLDPFMSFEFDYDAGNVGTPVDRTALCRGTRNSKCDVYTITSVVSLRVRLRTGNGSKVFDFVVRDVHNI